VSGGAVEVMTNGDETASDCGAVEDFAGLQHDLVSFRLRCAHTHQVMRPAKNACSNVCEFPYLDVLSA
jgi:hypothetical protein